MYQTIKIYLDQTFISFFNSFYTIKAILIMCKLISAEILKGGINPKTHKSLQLEKKRLHIFNSLMHIAVIGITVISCVNAKSLQSHRTDVNWENDGLSDIRRNIDVIGNEKQFVGRHNDNLGVIENSLDEDTKSKVSTP